VHNSLGCATKIAFATTKLAYALMHSSNFNKKVDFMPDKQTQIKFTGQAGEYFGIWIVNLLLSIVTLGIYSAWAKVRKKKYFYHNTLIDGVGFDYHAKPISILKGRVIAFIIFVLYQLAAQASPIVAAILPILFSMALPWIFVRGLTFNARNSSHRGLRFDFNGRYGQAARVLILYPFLALITLGLALPFVAQRMNQFIFNHHQFGLSAFVMKASVSDFYKIYLKLFAVLLLIGIVGSVAMKTASEYTHKHISVNSEQNHSIPTASLAKHTGGLIAVAAAEQDLDTATEGKNYLDKLSPAERAELEVQMQAEKAKAQKPNKNNPFEVFRELAKKYGAGFFIFSLIPILIYALVISAFSAYIKSRVTNLLWNHTTLEHLGFSSQQRMRDLLWIYLSNILVLICTLGLATPWAQIRLARYHMQHIAITGETDWDQFVGERKEATRALGEEIADMFDVDLSFG
jgi:uncharacterized membrane protein YjgN (DUF898 family)